jgi:UDP-2,3-diacylglucosamine pyrophosphatase LpxH
VPNSDQNHDCIVRHLSRPAFCDLRLVARLHDPRIGNADNNRVYVFIPDLHLVSNDWLLHYSYHFNEPTGFYRMLFRLRAAASEIASHGGTLSTIQLGDLYDLWRDGDAPNPSRIITDNQHLIEMLHSHAAGLRARLLVGNHDVGMTGAPNWYLRLFLPDETAGAFALVFHGDWLDSLLHSVIPDWLQKFALLLGGSLPAAHEYPIATLRQVMIQESAKAGEFASHIMLAEPGRLKALARAGATVALPAEVNVTRKSRGDDVHPFLTHARILLTYMRENAGPAASPAWPTTRLVILGHTHQPRISVDDSDPNNPLFMVDCGAWIENYLEPGGSSKPNCQLGVLAGNDVRLYQLDPL